MENNTIVSTNGNGAGAVVRMPEMAGTDGVAQARLPRLVDWLYKTSNSRNETKLDLAKRLGVSYGYLAQLASRQRSTEGITSTFARSCAIYLGVPPVAVMLYAGRIKSLDFLTPEADHSRAAQLAQGLERIAQDPMVGCLMPEEVWDVPDSVKALLVALYEDVTQQELFQTRRLLSLFQGLQNAALELEDQGAANDEEIAADFLTRKESPDPDA